jgi:phosphoribosylformylglycinamidine synthase
MSEDVKNLDFHSMSDPEIESSLKNFQISLTISEAKKVQDLLGRPPSITEAVVWGIQGSEHCSYKSTRPYLRSLPTDGKYVILGPSEDSGIVEIANVDGKKYGIVMAHESHNHPSQVVPYEGAATGIGGITRDITCMGAKVIATADPLRFGQIDRNETKLIADGVVAGIEGYGNPIGVPNIAGDVYFNQDYNDNCLVNVVALGVLAEDEIIHSYAPKGAGEEGHAMIVVGKPTDQSGFGGASFSSQVLNEEDKQTNKGAVQEPNPFLKKHLFSATYDLFRKLKEMDMIHRVSFKDHGAGGNVCSTVEQVEPAGYGAVIDLEKVPTAVDGLPPYVIACSETQERFMWIVPQEIKQMVIDHYNITWDLPDIAKGAMAAEIGHVTTEEKYIMRWHGEEIINARPCDITEGLLVDRPHTPVKKEQSDTGIDLSWDEIVTNLKKVVSHENVASRAPIYENYDKDVQGITIIEPGEADAGLIAPLLNRFELDGREEQKVGVALSVDANPRYGRISAKDQAAHAVVEGMRNVAAIGATPWCITDCLNYGSPEAAEQMQEIIDGIEGVGEALRAIPVKGLDEPTPCISGNVSLYNFSKNMSIPPSAIIGMLGRIPDYSKAITMDIKDQNSALYLVGNRKKEMGGSVLFEVLEKDLSEGKLPELNYESAKAEIYSMIDAVDNGSVVAAHDISDGGMIVSILEMFFNGPENLGAMLDIPSEVIGLTMAETLFTETGGFICQVTDDEKFKQTINQHGAVAHKLGELTQDATLTINDQKLTIKEFKELHTNGLRTKLK